MNYTFSQADTEAAYLEWGCNCGPAALAFALQTTLDKVRPAIPDFEERCYTNPTMMRDAIRRLGRKTTELLPARSVDELHVAMPRMFGDGVHLVRVQWTGPWIIGGKPARWAARQTHWITTWTDHKDIRRVFDINCGIVIVERWLNETVPAITRTVNRADGGWYPANIWRLKTDD